MPPKTDAQPKEKEAVKEKDPAKEEEEAFLKQREEEYEKLLKEREKAVAKYQRYLETQQEREKQKEATNDKWKNTTIAENEYRKECRDLIWWNRYLNEPNRQNCLIPQEINTFISLWDRSMKSLKYVNNAITTALELIDDIHYTEYLYPDSSKFIRSGWCEQITQIENEIKNSLLGSTLKILINAVDILDMKTGNLQYSNIQSNCTLLLWWNVTKNPKYRYYNYEEAGLSFELPKPMVVENCLLQLRYDNYDHLSHYCHTYLTKTKPYCEKAEEMLPPPPVQMPSTSQIMILPNTTSLPTEAKSLPTEAKSGLTLDELDLEAEEQTLPEEETASELTILSSPRESAPCELEIVGVGDTCSTSLDLNLVDDAPEEELLSGEISLREFYVLRGIWTIELLYVPPQPIRVDRWKIHEESAKFLQPFPYVFVFKLATSDKSFNPEDDYEAEKEAARRRNELDKLVLINVKIPTDSVIWMDSHRSPTLARWDEYHKCWTTRDTYDVKYDEETMIFSFRLSVFGSFAFLQHKFIAFPYQSWNLAPMSENTVKLSVQNAVVSIEIEISKDDCMLLQLIYNDQLCLKKLYNKPMVPKILLRKLQECGVNLFPEHDSYKYIEQDIKTKDWNLEQDIYRNIALTCNAFEFGSSRWNGSLGSRKVVFKLREQISTTMKGPQHLVLSTLQETCVLQIIEASQEYSEEPALGQGFNTNLYHLVLSTASYEAKELVKECPAPLVMVVNTMLLCLKPFSYCQ